MYILLQVLLIPSTFGLQIFYYRDSIVNDFINLVYYEKRYSDYISDGLLFDIHNPNNHLSFKYGTIDISNDTHWIVNFNQTHYNKSIDFTQYIHFCFQCIHSCSLQDIAFNRALIPIEYEDVITDLWNTARKRISFIRSIISPTVMNM